MDDWITQTWVMVLLGSFLAVIIMSFGIYVFVKRKHLLMKQGALGKFNKTNYSRTNNNTFSAARAETRKKKKNNNLSANLHTKWSLCGVFSISSLSTFFLIKTNQACVCQRQRLSSLLIRDTSYAGDFYNEQCVFFRYTIYNSLTAIYSLSSGHLFCGKHFAPLIIHSPFLSLQWRIGIASHWRAIIEMPSLLVVYSECFVWFEFPLFKQRIVTTATNFKTVLQFDPLNRI